VTPAEDFLRTIMNNDALGDGVEEATFYRVAARDRRDRRRLCAASRAVWNRWREHADCSAWGKRKACRGEKWLNLMGDHKKVDQTIGDFLKKRQNQRRALFRCNKASASSVHASQSARHFRD
jgi:hypothetical protein